VVVSVSDAARGVAWTSVFCDTLRRVIAQDATTLRELTMPAIMDVWSGDILLPGGNTIKGRASLYNIAVRN
jgi:hypothetical protein